MSGYGTIVVGTDGSDRSLKAVERAAQVASADDADLVVVTAYTPGPRGSNADGERELKDDAYLVRGIGPPRNCSPGR